MGEIITPGADEKVRPTRELQAVRKTTTGDVYGVFHVDVLFYSRNSFLHQYSCLNTRTLIHALFIHRNHKFNN